MKTLLGLLVGWVGLAIKALTMTVIHMRVWYESLRFGDTGAHRYSRGCALLTEVAVALIRIEYWCYCRACVLRGKDLEVYMSDDIADLFGLTERRDE